MSTSNKLYLLYRGSDMSVESASLRRNTLVNQYMSEYYYNTLQSVYQQFRVIKLIHEAG